MRIGLALTTALDHLHKHGLAHRDVKPSNIIFVHGIPKLADIGLVTTLDATVSFVGTPGYLPPEGPGSPQADIYSLGKVLYEVSAGRDRQNFPELPTDWEGFANEDGILELNAVVLKACHHDPRQRYRSAREMHADLTARWWSLPPMIELPECGMWAPAGWSANLASRKPIVVLWFTPNSVPTVNGSSPLLTTAQRASGQPGVACQSVTRSSMD